jgi:hypothetical protein
MLCCCHALSLLCSLCVGSGANFVLLKKKKNDQTPPLFVSFDVPRTNIIVVLSQSGRENNCRHACREREKGKKVKGDGSRGPALVHVALGMVPMTPNRPPAGKRQRALTSRGRDARPTQSLA